MATYSFLSAFVLMGVITLILTSCRVAKQSRARGNSGGHPGLDVATGMVVGHAWQLVGDSFADAIEGARIDVPRTCQDRQLRQECFLAALEVLAASGFVTVEGDIASLTPAGWQLLRQRGYARWAHGYSRVLEQAERLATDPAEGARLRDGADVAQGSAQIGREHVDRFVDELVRQRDFQTLLGLGCGSALREIRYVAERAHRRGVGLDISPAACKIAEHNAQEAGLGDRMAIVCGDAGKAAQALGGQQFDVVLAMFVLHDLVSQDEDSIRQVARLVRPGGRLVAAEVAPYHKGTDCAFVACFSWIHTLMGQRLWTKSQWREAVERAGLVMSEIRDTDMPGAFVFSACRPVEDNSRAAGIIRELPRFRTFSGHSRPVPMFVSDSDLAPMAGSEVVAVDLSGVPTGVWFTERHTHDRPEVYLCPEAEGVVAIEVDRGGEVTSVESPFAVLVRAAVPHRFRLRRAPPRTSYLLGLFPFRTNHSKEDVP